MVEAATVRSMAGVVKQYRPSESFSSITGYSTSASDAWKALSDDERIKFQKEAEELNALEERNNYSTDQSLQEVVNDNEGASVTVQDGQLLSEQGNTDLKAVVDNAHRASGDNIEARGVAQAVPANSERGQMHVSPQAENQDEHTSGLFHQERSQTISPGVHTFPRQGAGPAQQEAQEAIKK